MESKTMGSFLAALRRARGLTQKELAEQLNVSDKSISRWERDETAPDLSMIPVLAEFFGITSDELLRGERRTQDPAAESVPSQKGEKQRRRLLRSALTQYRNRSLISAGLSGAGLLAALVGNFAFLKAAPGFFAGTVLFLAALVTQGIWLNSALLTVSDEELYTPQEAGAFRQDLFRGAAWVLGLTVVLFAATLNPMLTLPDPAHSGLEAGAYLLSALVCGGVALLLFGAVLWLLSPVLLRRGILVLNEAQQVRRTHNRRLLVRCVSGLLALLVLTFGVEMTALHGGRYLALAEGTVYTDYASFVERMETPTPPDEDLPPLLSDDNAVVPIPQESMPLDVTYYDEFGNVISEEEALYHELVDRDGNVLCSYIARNRDASISYGPERDGYLPIKVSTAAQDRAAQQKASRIQAVFVLVYGAEVVGAALLYLLRREKQA